MKFKIFLLLIGCVAFISCSKEDDNIAQPVNNHDTTTIKQNYNDSVIRSLVMKIDSL